MRVEFNSRPFVASHSRQPRGFGCWVFQFEDSAEPWFAPHSMSFAEAKKAAVEEARRRARPGAAVAHVKVMP